MNEPEEKDFMRISNSKPIVSVNQRKISAISSYSGQLIFAITVQKILMKNRVFSALYKI